eukprot:GILK01006638.1.p1 GENE.GILK01006638.1~~GILK01006638.1.p1  ORF type:complete len:186 (+),score=31.05 GILK01006638.1:43-558(+)
MANMQDGTRTRKLRQALEKAVANTVKACNNAKFRECFPKLTTQHGPALDDLCAQLLAVYSQNVQQEFLVICQEADVSSKLAALDNLLCEQSVSVQTGMRRVPPPSLSPEKEIRDMCVKEKRKEKEALTKRVRELEGQTGLLESELRSKRARWSAFDDVVSQCQTKCLTASD